MTYDIILREIPEFALYPLVKGHLVTLLAAHGTAGSYVCLPAHIVIRSYTSLVHAAHVCQSPALYTSSYSITISARRPRHMSAAR